MKKIDIRGIKYEACDTCGKVYTVQKMFKYKGKDMEVCQECYTKTYKSKKLNKHSAQLAVEMRNEKMKSQLEIV